MHRGGVSPGNGRGRYRGGRGSRGGRGGRGSSRGGHPSGLTGKDIGLWYARRGRQKREKLDFDNRSVISLNKEHEDHIASLLLNDGKIKGKPSDQSETWFNDKSNNYHGVQNDKSKASYHHETYNHKRHHEPHNQCHYQNRIHGSNSYSQSCKNKNNFQNEPSYQNRPNYQNSPNFQDKRSYTNQHENYNYCNEANYQDGVNYQGFSHQDEGNKVISEQDNYEDGSNFEQGSNYRSTPDMDNVCSSYEEHGAGLKGQSRQQRRARLDIENRPVVLLKAEDEEDITLLLNQHQIKVEPMDDEPSASDERHDRSTLSLNIDSYSQLDLNVKQKLDTCSANDFSYCGKNWCNLVKNMNIDNQLYDQIVEMEKSVQYKEMLEFRKQLPSYQMKEKLLHLMLNNQVLVISGETGCGKTTQVAQFILDDAIKQKQGSTCHIVCTQPRRISAISVAERVSSERVEQIGRSCGYQIRLEKKLPRSQGSILYCTTGVLLRKLITDPYMLNVSHVVLDEIHERDVMSDFLLIIIRDLLPFRPDLKVILMSATLNAEMFSQYFDNCPMLHIPGFTFPVEEYYLEDVVDMLSYRVDTQQRRQKPFGRGRCRHQEMEDEQKFDEYLSSIEERYSSNTLNSLRNMDFKETDNNLVVRLITHICTHLGDGAILIFLPGWDQISKLHELLIKNPVFNANNYILIPLHSMMPTSNQKSVFNRPPSGVRKIVIATNIAETSITIDDVVFVIDCGKSKEKTYDVEQNISCLQPVWVSKASARQRRGRAGRVQAGYCFHLFTSYHANGFEEYQLPEMLRTPLDQLCLQLKILRLGKVNVFLSKAMQPPKRKAIENAVSSLMQMRALDENETLTALGYHVAKLPVAPKVGRMILFGAMFSCLDPVLTIAASLDFKQPFYIPIHKEKEADQKRIELAQGSKSDHIMLVNAFKGWEEAKRHSNDEEYCWNYFLSANTLRMILNLKKQFTQLLYDIGFLTSADNKDKNANKESGNVNLVKAIICAGLYPNVAKIQYVNGLGNRVPVFYAQRYGKVEIHPKSVNTNVRLYETQWLIYHEKLKTSKLFLYDSTMISPFPLLFFGGAITVHQEQGHDTIEVDEGIKFHSPIRIAQLVKDLRQALDELLNKKITTPSMELGVGRMAESRDEKILRAIIDLITTEKVKTKSDSGYK